jgi:hypothetical protein
MVHNMCGASMASLCASQPNGDRTSAVEGLVDGRPSGPSRLAVRRGAGVSAGRVADGAGGRNGQTRKKPYRLQYKLEAVTYTNTQPAKSRQNPLQL